ncbi:MAG TPA: cache domain-containing protein, partial [bacterium]|nr:cache domain-containing protein [bacterium]
MSFRGRLALLIVLMLGGAVIPLMVHFNRQMEREAAYVLARHRDSIIELRRDELRNIAEVAVTLAGDYLQRVRTGELTAQAARERFINRLQYLRFDHGRGYYWLHEFRSGIPGREPVIVMHPMLSGVVGSPVSLIWDLPRLNAVFVGNREVQPGTAEFNRAGITPVQLMVDANRICATAGEGYIEYFWNKPTDTATVSTVGYRKLSYVRLIAAWDLVIGCGLYIDDIERDLLLWERQSLQHARESTAAAVTLGLSALAFCLLLGVYLSRRLTRSVEAIVVYAGQITRGEHPEMPRRGDDEFGLVREAFRRMVTAIAEREWELRDHARELSRHRDHLEE